MAKLLTIDEMLEAAAESGMPGYQLHIQAIERAASALAHDLALHLNLHASKAEHQGLNFGGTCAAFSPKEPGQKCPEVLTWFDRGAEFEDDDEIIVLDTPAPDELDVELQQHGHLVLLTPRTGRAKTWLDNNLSKEETPLFLNESIVVEPRYCPDIVAAAQADGLCVGR